MSQARRPPDRGRRPRHGLQAQIARSDPGKELRWLGKLGLSGIAAGEHFFVLTTNADGTTRLNHGERYSGALIALAKGSSANSGAAYEAFS